MSNESISTDTASLPSVTADVEDRYIIQGRRTEQVSDSEWERVNKTLIVTDDTTVKEIIEWGNKHKLDIHCGLFLWPADFGGKR